PILLFPKISIHKLAGQNQSANLFWNFKIAYLYVPRGFVPRCKVPILQDCECNLIAPWNLEYHSMSKMKWFIYTVLLGLSPALIRIVISVLTSGQNNLQCLNEADL